MTIQQAARKHGIIGERILLNTVAQEGGPPWREVIEERILEAHADWQSGAPRAGEILLKNWKKDEAARKGASVHAIESRLSRGKYPLLKLRRVNARLIYVLP